MDDQSKAIKARNTEIAEEIEKYVRIETHPVGVKFYKNEQEIPDEEIIPNLTFCELTTIARRYPEKKMYKMTKRSVICPHAIATLGFGDWGPYNLSGEFDKGVHFASLEGAKKALDHVPRIKPGTYEGVIVSALKNMEVEPDLYFMAVSGAQALRSVEAFIFNTGGGFDMGMCGICGVCGYTIAHTMIKKTASLGIPCYGAHRIGGVTDNELTFAVHREQIDNFLDGLAKTFATGHSIPVPYSYIQSKFLPPHYKIVEWPDKIIPAPKNWEEHEKAGLPKNEG
ncbi:MAG: DUF169 domain-containing protein [Desulfobacterales bacterium]|nr:DUF169 domain-containing protein [Desulfobacterales bacterium]